MVETTSVTLAVEALPLCHSKGTKTLEIRRLRQLDPNPNHLQTGLGQKKKEKKAQTGFIKKRSSPASDTINTISRVLITI